MDNINIKIFEKVEVKDILVSKHAGRFFNDSSTKFANAVMKRVAVANKIHLCLFAFKSIKELLKSGRLIIMVIIKLY